MATRFSNPAPQFLDANGDVYASGKLVFYDNGTTTPKNVYSDVAGTISLGNELTLDASGRVQSFFGSGTYRVRLLDSAGVQIWERDDIIFDEDSDNQFSAWNSQTPYGLNEIRQGSDGNYYISLSDPNLNNNPVTDLVNWSKINLLESYNPNKTYSVGDLVIASDGYIYRSKVNSNINNDPTISTNEWGTATSTSVTSAYPKGYLFGLNMTKDAGDTLHDVNFAVGATRDSTDTANINITSAIIKRIDANWSAGSGQGGFPSALSLTADTTYYTFVLLKDDDTAVDAGFDDNINATNLLADATDFDRFRLLGTLRTNSSSDIDVLNVYRTGTVVQVVNYETGAVATGATTIPKDDTIPQNNEGNEYMTLSIRPSSSSNILIVDVMIAAVNSTSTSDTITAALFQDSGANAIATALGGRYFGNGFDTQIYLSHYMTAGTTSTTTFKVRVGADNSGTTTFNGEAGARLYGGTLASGIKITEIQV